MPGCLTERITQLEERVAKQTEVEGLRDRTDIARGRVSQTTVRTGTRASED